MSALKSWIVSQRTSVRLAFILRLISMGVSAALSLVWTRALLHTLGSAPYGIFLSFLGVTRLGGIGDLGLTGAVAVRTAQAIGRGEFDKLQNFLPASRSLLFLVAAGLSLVFLILSPWLPHWLGFENVPGSGSLTLLFATGAPALFMVLVGGYFHSVNHAYGTVTWPIIPILMTSQIGMACQLALAWAGAPLWIQHLGVLVFSALGVFISWWMLRVSHPWLGNIFPLRIDTAVWRDLASTSGWMYLYSLGYAIYASTDRILVNAGFGAAQVPVFVVNSKLCELALQVVIGACLLSLPKITRWIASGEAGDRETAVGELRRLGIFQSLLGIIAACIYLLINDLFIRVWLGEGYEAPPLMQFAFALNLAITCGCDAAVETAGLCGADGLRKAGMTIGATALLNLGLSYAAMKYGSMSGIAFATVLAQLISGIILSRVTTHHLRTPLTDWIVRGCVVPIVAVSAVFGIRSFMPHGFQGIALGCLLVGLVFLGAARVLGVNRALLWHEWRSISAILKARRETDGAEQRVGE